MEFIESFKLTDIARVEAEGLDRKDLAKRVADTFLYQIVDTAYFHCDPHPGNLAVDTKGNLVYYDFGMMDELSPNVKAGFKEFCFAWSRRPAVSRHRRDSSPAEKALGGLFTILRQFRGPRRHRVSRRRRTRPAARPGLPY